MLAHGVGVPAHHGTAELLISGTGQRLIKSCGFEPTPIRAHCPIPTVKTYFGPKALVTSKATRSLMM